MVNSNMERIKILSASEARRNFLAVLRMVKSGERVIITWRPGKEKKREEKFEIRFLTDEEETFLDSILGTVRQNHS